MAHGRFQIGEDRSVRLSDEVRGEDSLPAMKARSKVHPENIGDLQRWGHCSNWQGSQDHPCSFLSVGQAFEGTQNVSHNVQLPGYKEEWKVNVRLQGCDLQQGYVCGSMEALNVPSAKSSVVTFWEGEIIDNVNYTFCTPPHWGTDRATDLKHWSKFKCFAPLKDAVLSFDYARLDLQSFPYVFMRWKEKCFINVGPDCGLTIAGFYYVCFTRADGSLEGFYYDPNSSPFQRLQLKASCEGRQGQSFGTYSFR
mmetsp:Transcript_25087/g.47412  ORF Transcript_25087/g.47412 Transcript_25087/m.47412 type:complete len:253 (-) Transcript_25087:370-1128(-)|eukprot:CAMPEP_0114263740 /NCGR_PEP_ID=MMETSP0058-20121206/22725_1 /TAXON_ID=36894 /ORGANISM="Pyramimonas parkeae, CCMP726" /LENGTH=252 /DNA_ID=CAMNT_0001380149 /DNA_START=193 /DNA_END=951 /DNA_ORIENTATION=+